MEPILRDKLAIDRTRLANQRTLLSYVRTGMYFIATALAVFHLDDKVRFSWFEWLLTVVGFLSIIIGLINYLLMRRKVNRLYQ